MKTKRLSARPPMVVLACFLMSLTLSVRAQNEPGVYPKNSIKINLSSLALKNYNFTYERSIARKITVVGGYRFMPTSNLGELSAVSKVLDKIDDSDIADDLNSISASNKTYTGEIRFYKGKRDGNVGLYTALYARYAKFNLDYDYDYSTDSRTYNIPLRSEVKGFGGGIMFGAQWRIAKRLNFDWYIIGAHYGSLKGTINGATDLSSMTNEERENLKDDLESDLSIGDKSLVEVDVQTNGVKGKPSAPFLGIRGLGFNLGFTF